jgi:plasmid stability protein
VANLTLSIDDDLLKQCRLYAVQHDTSVNALVREYLGSLVGQSQARARLVEELNQLADEAARLAEVPEDYRWRREDAYVDRMARQEGK